MAFHQAMTQEILIATVIVLATYIRQLGCAKDEMFQRSLFKMFSSLDRKINSIQNTLTKNSIGGFYDVHDFPPLPIDSEDKLNHHENILEDETLRLKIVSHLGSLGGN